MDVTVVGERPRIALVQTPAAAAHVRGWDALLISVAAYVLTAVARVHQLFSALEILHTAALAGALAVTLYVTDSQPRRRAALLGGSTTTLLLLLLAWSAISVPFALNAGTSFTFVANDFVKTILMSLVVAGSVRDVDDVERLALVYFVGAVIYAAVVISRFNLGDGSNWRLGHLYYYDANDFATFVVTAIPFGIYFVHAGRTLTIRGVAFVGLILLTLGFVWSGSRGGFLALATVAAFVVLRYSAIPVRWRVSATALVAIVVLATASNHYWRQMDTITSDSDYNHTSETGRLQIWNRGLGYMLANPLLGVGPSNFPAAEGTLSPLAERQQYGIGVRWNAPHDCFVQIGAETGIPGLALFVGIFVTAFTALRRAGRAERVLAAASGRPLLTPAVTASLLGFLVGGVFLSLAYSEMLYTLIAFAIGLHKVTVHAASL